MTERLLTPFLGVAVYTWLLAVAGLDGTARQLIRESGFLDVVGVGLCIWTLADRFARDRRVGLPRPSHALGWTLLTLCGWVVVTAVAASQRGDFTAETDYRTRQFLFAAVVFFATTNGYAHRWHLPILGLPLAGIVLLEAAREYNSLALDQNIAAFGALTIPALAGAASLWAGPGSFAYVTLIGALALVVAVTRNRGGALAVAATALMLAVVSKRRLLWLGLLGALTAASVAVASGSGYFDRFRDIWTRGPAYDSVQDRFNLWSAGWRLALANPVAGTGPGNYGPARGDRADPHNYLVAMAAETGFVGAVLYVGFFVGALAVGLRRGPLRPAIHMARVAGLAGVTSFLVVGFFLGLQTHALAFVYAGMAQLAGSKQPALR